MSENKTLSALGFAAGTVGIIALLIAIATGLIILLFWFPPFLAGIIGSGWGFGLGLAADVLFVLFIAIFMVVRFGEDNA